MARRELIAPRAALRGLAVCLALGAGACGGGEAEGDPLIRALEDRCEGGALGACVELGHAYRQSTRIGPDTDKAVALYRRACDGGEVGGCIALGYLYENGLGVERDIGAATALYRRACEGGEAEACGALEAIEAAAE